MIIVAQRVTKASVRVNGTIIAQIQQGVLAFIGIESSDDSTTIQRSIDKLLNLRIFEDTQGKMNLNCKEVNGSLLLVPQFTLLANTNNGNRPSFSNVAPPSLSKPVFDKIKLTAQKIYSNVAFGEFGADMKISLTNDGPATFTLRL